MANNINIGPKIELAGDKAFRQAVAGINKDMSVLGSEMKKVSAEFAGGADSMESITAKSAVYNKQIDAQKSKINVLQKALADATAEYGANSDKVKDWQIKLNNAEADLSKTENSLNDLNKELDETGQEFDSAGKSAVDFGNVMGKVGTAVASAVVAMGAAAAGAAVALAKLTVDTAKYADDIITLSVQTGIATDTLQEYKYAAELVDVSVETLTGSMAKQIRSMSQAQDGSKQFVDAYNQLGISVTDVNGNLRDSETVYWEAIDALKQISNETERDAIAMQILGKSAQELNPVIAQGSAGMKQFAAEAHEVGAVMDTETLRAFGEFDDAAQRLTQGAEAAKRALSVILLPQLTELATVGTDLLSEFTNGLNAAGDDMEKVGELVGKLIGDVIQKAADMIPKVIELGASMIKSLASAIMENLPKIVDTGLEVIVSLTNGIAESLPELIPTIVETILYVVDAIVDNLPALLDASLAIILALADGIVKSIPKMIEMLPEIIDKIIEFINESLPEISEAGKELFTALWANMSDIEDSLKDALEDFKQTFKEEWERMYPTWQDYGAALVENLLKGLLGPIPAIVEVFKFLGSLGKTTGQSGGTGQYFGNNAAGTDYWRGGWTWVGEQGPELMNLPRGTQIVSSEKSKAVGGDIYNIVIDAKNVREFNDVVRIAKGARQSTRMGVV